MPNANVIFYTLSIIKLLWFLLPPIDHLVSDLSVIISFLRYLHLYGVLKAWQSIFRETMMPRADLPKCTPFTLQVLLCVRIFI